MVRAPDGIVDSSLVLYTSPSPPRPSPRGVRGRAVAAGGDFAARTLFTSFLYRTKHCRCEVSHESVVMALNSNAGEKKEGSESVEPAHCIIRRKFRADPAGERRLVYDQRDTVPGIPGVRPLVRKPRVPSPGSRRTRRSHPSAMNHSSAFTAPDALSKRVGPTILNKQIVRAATSRFDRRPDPRRLSERNNYPTDGAHVAQPIIDD
ncbi:hypothetical protein EVAR_9775_1 [Eumeta japonica]|uniref:Uncharacterized protein n=1 Tax=Eumeta variegata TaxID=151549 RepID=A0A4C1U5Q4_EUMVA|nr:hypothetical protein EVAR_9775_1 [Eumeta japonica]